MFHWTPFGEILFATAQHGEKEQPKNKPPYFRPNPVVFLDIRHSPFFSQALTHVSKKGIVPVTSLGLDTTMHMNSQPPPQKRRALAFQIEFVRII
jgi:hypothetical protein